MLKSSYFLLLLGAAVLAAPVYAQRIDGPIQAALTPEQQAALRPLQLMCEGLAKKDAKLIQVQLLPGGMATQIREGKPVQEHFDFFEARLQQVFASTHSQFEEILYHPIVSIDHDIAVIWAPYVFTVDGKMDHCGTNVFTMYRQNDKWLVSNVADTGRRDVCPSS
jgi:hypothetical protein